MASEQAVADMPVAVWKYSKRVILKSIIGRDDGGVGLLGQRVVVGGWVKSSREIRKELATAPTVAAPEVAPPPKDVSCVEVLQSRIPFFRTILKVLGGSDHRIRDKLDVVAVQKPPQSSTAFLQINDGSCVPALLVLVDSTLAAPSQVMPTGTSILVEGILEKPSLQQKHLIQLNVEKILHFGMVDQDRYPLSKKRIPLETLRDCPHFRPRTTTVASVMRIRNALTLASHTFLQSNGFLHVDVPVITSTDAEGNSKKFQVITYLVKGKIHEEPDQKHNIDGINLEAVKTSIREKSKQIEELKRTDSNKEVLAAAIQDLKKTNELLLQMEEREHPKSKVPVQSDKLKVTEEFFSGPTFLTVSARLHLASYASGLGNVYSFGSNFNATKLESKKSLAEMRMVELEMAFGQIEDAIDCASDFLKFLCKWLLENCAEDLFFVSKRIDKTSLDRLQLIISSPYEKISYAKAVEILRQVTEKRFQNVVQWGVSLSEEHESYLADEIYKRPVIIYNHPKELKPFNVRMNDDQKTVASFEVIIPKVGTLIRGSQNEERLKILSTRITELGLENKQYEWYLDLQRHGAVQQSGLSLLFDPLVLYATGLNDIKDVVPFPRSFDKANN